MEFKYKVVLTGGGVTSADSAVKPNIVQIVTQKLELEQVIVVQRAGEQRLDGQFVESFEEFLVAQLSIIVSIELLEDLSERDFILLCTAVKHTQELIFRYVATSILIDLVEHGFEVLFAEKILLA